MIAFDAKPLTRRERAETVKKRDVFTKYGDQARAVLDALLAKYADEGVLNLDDATVLRIPPFTQLGTPVQLIGAFGGRDGFVGGRPRTSIRPAPGDRLTHVRPHPRQIHPEHHAPGHRRRRRCPAHQPVVLDVLPQDHRRSGPGTGADAATDYASPIPEAYQWRTWAADPEGITGDELLAFVE